MLADEMAAVESGQAEGCGHLCDCHSPHHPCLRAAHPDADHNRVPHVARLGDGTLTQWTGPCPPVVDPQLQAQMDAEAETHRQAKAAEHAELIQAMFAAIGAHKKATGKLPWE